MRSGNFTDEFKRDAVAQITERGYPVAEVSKRLGVDRLARRGVVDRLRQISVLVALVLRQPLFKAVMIFLTST